MRRRTGETPRFINAPCVPELGKDAFPPVPCSAGKVTDAVERVPTTTFCILHSDFCLPPYVFTCPARPGKNGPRT
jgi:hypothetical protein